MHFSEAFSHMHVCVRRKSKSILERTEFMFLHNAVVAVSYTFDFESGPSPVYAVCPTIQDAIKQI